MALVDALWVGPGGYTLIDGTVLTPGITVCKVPAGEAHDSDNWQSVEKPKTPKTTATGSDADAGAGEDS